MIRKLFLLAGAGFVLTLICLVATAALVRHDLEGAGFNLTSLEMDDDFKITPAGSAKPEPIVTQSLTWTGGNTLGLDLPAEVVYVNGPKASVSVSGPKDLVDRVRLVEGRLFMTPGWKVRKIVNLRLIDGRIKAQNLSGDFKVVVTAPRVSDFDITGSGDLSLENYNQPALSLSISGAGTVRATGTVKTLKLDISGEGDANLEDLKVTDADIHISGAGDANVNATGLVKVDISGKGDVNLNGNPTRLERHISGLGGVHVD